MLTSHAAIASPESTSTASTVGNPADAQYKAPANTLTATAEAADPTIGWEKDTPAADGKIHRGKWTIDPKTGIQVAPLSNSYDCINTYACFFENINYNDQQSGWIERYHDIQQAVFLIHNDQMTSWWNRRSCRSEWDNGNFFETIYNMPAGAYVSYVGNSANDTATFFSNKSC